MATQVVVWLRFESSNRGDVVRTTLWIEHRLRQRLIPAHDRRFQVPIGPTIVSRAGTVEVGEQVARRPDSNRRKIRLIK